MGICQLTKWWWPVRAIAFAGVFHFSDAAAQVVTVSFERAQAEAIPISSWTVVSIAAALGFAAYWALRSRAGPALRVLVATTIAASVVAATVQSNWIREARASDPAVISLGTSPAQLTIPSEAIFGMMVSGSGYQIAVANATGGPVTITGVAIEQNIPENPLIFYSGSPGPICAVGLNVGTKATCYLYVQATNHFS